MLLKLCVLYLIELVFRFFKPFLVVSKIFHQLVWLNEKL